MSTADKLNKVLETKLAIKQAINNKGVVVTDSTKFADYPAKIAAISTGGFGDASTYELLWNAATNNNTDYSRLFSDYSGTELDISILNTSNVTDMSYIFYGCKALTSLDVSNFNTSNVTNMTYMFSYCQSLASLDVSNFNTSKVTTMNSMFYNCESLTSIIGLENFDTSNVTDMNDMFSSGWNYNGFIELDLSSFNTSNVTNMGYMFKYCYYLTTLDISNFDMGKVTNTSNMFSYCKALHTLRLDNCSNDTISKIINSSNFPTDAIEGVTRTIFCKESEVKKEGSELTAPENWEFSYISEE